MPVIVFQSHCRFRRLVHCRYPRPLVTRKDGSDEKFIRTWNAAEKKLDTTIQKGYYTARDMSFGISMLTRIFGSFTFGKNSKVQAIRHEIRPSVSLSYKPNFNSRNFYTTQIDTLGNTATETFYQRSIYGSFSRICFAGLNFGIDNILQMKVIKKIPVKML